MTDRLYYQDSFLASFDAVITDIRLVSRSGTEAVWQVALDRSAFYPTSGGQPYDLGKLAATSRQGTVLEVPVLQVEEDEDGEVWHQTAKPLVAGTPVHAEIEWARRLDHMQQHSGQHLLSAIFVRELGAQTVSFHLGNTSSTIDLTVASLTPAEIERVERLANEAIAEDRPVRSQTVDRPQAEALLRSGRLRKLPERDGDIRLIEIEGIDWNACGGTHVRSTGQIGSLAVRSLERVRQGVRVEFVSGLRAIAAARRDFQLLTESAAALSIQRDAVPETIGRLLSDARQAAKEKQKLREELAGFEAGDLLGRAPRDFGMRLVRADFPHRDPDYVKLLAAKIAAVPGSLAMLASTQQEPATLVMARAPDVACACGDLLKRVLAVQGLRGGGSPSMAQGQAPQAALPALFSALEAAARSSLTPPQ